MPPESDDPKDTPPTQAAETSAMIPEPPTSDTAEGTDAGPIPGQRRVKKGLTGGYYWFPAPSPDGITWSVVTCHDLGCDPDAGHDADLWPRLMVRLASAWGKDAQVLKRRLALAYTGVPRGRVTRPDKTYLILHGKDSPISGWEELVIESFRLSGRKVKFIFDEHETQIPGHPEKFASVLGPVR